MSKTDKRQSNYTSCIRYYIRNFQVTRKLKKEIFLYIFLSFFSHKILNFLRAFFPLQPVYLKVNLSLNAGMINCCNLKNIAQFCFRVPDNYLDLVSMLPDICAKTPATNRSSNFLHATPIKHDPYTPDSMESPSPNAMAAAGYTPNLELESLDKFEENGQHLKSDRTVSPALLKSKLEQIVKDVTQRSFDSDQENEMKKSSSDHRLHSLTDADNDSDGLRRDRSNSDVSWKKKKLFQTDVEDQGSHSYDNISSQSNVLLEIGNSNGCHREIPRIKIINASNMVSNESCHTDNPEGSSPKSSIEGSLNHKPDDSENQINDDIVSQLDNLKINNVTNIDESQKKKIKIDKSTQTDKPTQPKENGDDQSANGTNGASVHPDGTEVGEQTRKVRRKRRRRRAHDPNMMTLENSARETDIFNSSYDSTDQPRKLKTRKAGKRVNDRNQINISIEKERKRCCIIS